MSEIKDPVNTKKERKKVPFTDSVFFVIALTMLLYFGVCSVLCKLLVKAIHPMLADSSISDAIVFIIENYLVRIIQFVGVILYTYFVKKNRYIYDSFKPHYENNGFGTLALGLVIGLVMNGICVLIAVMHGDIQLSFGLTASQILVLIFALVCVFIQSASEEMWYRGFLYERVHANYPLWLAIFLSSAIFGFGHLFNKGVSFLAIMNIVVIGLAFALAKWFSKSIWLLFGIHTGWNFTQNFIFGLPNSGRASQVSVFTLDEANASGGLIYDPVFGVEGAITQLIVAVLLAVICFVLIKRAGRTAELKQSSGKASS